MSINNIEVAILLILLLNNNIFREGGFIYKHQPSDLL